MDDSAKSALALLSSVLTGVSGAMATEHILQIVFIVLGILGAICTLFLNGWRVYDKIKEAKKDGHIDEDEKKDIEESVKGAIEDFKSDIDDITGEKKK